MRQHGKVERANRAAFVLHDNAGDVFSWVMFRRDYANDGADFRDIAKPPAANVKRV